MKRYLIIFAVIVCFICGIVLTNRIGGGKHMETTVAEVVKTNSIIVGLVGSPVTKVDRSGGPWRVQIGLDGMRRGFFSFLVQGSNTNRDLKIDWTQFPNGTVELIRISLRKPYQQDELFWENTNFLKSTN